VTEGKVLKAKDFNVNNIGIGGELIFQIAADNAPKGSIGACLRRKRLGVWRNDGALTASHGKALGKKAWCKEAAAKYFAPCGTLREVVFDPDTPKDWGRVEFDWDWSCTCSGFASAALNQGWDTFGDFVAKLPGGAQAADHYGYGGKFGANFNARRIYSVAKHFNNVYHSGGFMKVQVPDAVEGHSGGALVYNGMVVGLMKGGDGDGTCYYTPIWEVALGNYEIC